MPDRRAYLGDAFKSMTKFFLQVHWLKAYEFTICIIKACKTCGCTPAKTIFTACFLAEVSDYCEGTTVCRIMLS